MLPAIYSIVAPSPVDAQSLPPPGAPTLTSLSPNQGAPGTTVAVTLTGTNFVVGATTVAVERERRHGQQRRRGISSTSLTVDVHVARPMPPPGPRNGDGHDGRRDERTP